jgi:hypothetical protein
MNIAIGADHGGFILKEKLRAGLAGMGHQVLDFGTDSAASCDYPDFAVAGLYHGDRDGHGGQQNCRDSGRPRAIHR